MVNVGLEIHVELKTRSKMFCSCATAFGSPSGSQCCPICMGLPGAMPTLNAEAVHLGALAGLALHSQVQSFSAFDRKQYFYPDMPKGYQITQRFHPLCIGGWLTLPETGKRIEITEMHLEEDSGKLVHERESSYVNFNRCGVPLLEIVTEPVIENGEQAYQFLNLLRDTLVIAGVTTGKMQEGALRVDVNVSIRKDANSPMGQRTELKNLSSFRAVRAAIEHEVIRQKALLDQGEMILAETRRWDEKGGYSIPLRDKEESRDYRYFPEPDLATLALDYDLLEQWEKELPVLPEEIQRRLISLNGMTAKHAETLANHSALLEVFDAANARIQDAKRVINWLLGDYRAIAKKLSLNPDRPPFPANDFANLMVESTKLGVSHHQIQTELINLCIRCSEKANK